MLRELAVTSRKRFARSWLPVCTWLLAGIALLSAVSCRDRDIAIAVIPRTTATPIWEAEHLGVQAVARKSNVRIYWNAPTREDDFEGQIALIERTMHQHYNGLILSPDNANALVTPVRSVLAHGTPVAIVGSPLFLPSSENLCYLLNDEDAGGRLAAQRLVSILKGRGTIAILGINPDIIGIVDRARVLVSTLGKDAPNIRIAEQLAGTFDEDHERQVARDLLDRYPHLDAIVTLSSASTHGLLEAIRESNAGVSRTRIVAFDRDDDERLLFDSPCMDSVVLEDTEQMGSEAVRQILGRLHGQPMCSTLYFEPLLVTRENLHQQMRRLHSAMDEIPPEDRWRWMLTQ